MTCLIALYKGNALSGIKLIAATTDPAIVSDFSKRLIQKPESSDPAVRQTEQGTKNALRLIAGEAEK